jgi:DNA-binding protein YbaB
LAQLADLQREASDLGARLQKAEVAASDTSGRDSSEQVRVTLTAAGRINAAEIAPGWRSRLTAEQLGSAVITASREAASRRAETWAAKSSRSDGTAISDDDIGVPKPTTPVYNSQLQPPDNDSIRGLWYLLQDAADRLDELASETASRREAATTAHDAAGHVTVMLTGGELSDVQLDPAWAAQASGREIGTAITAALANGYATIDGLAERSLIRQWPFPDLERYTSDPTTLLTALGLPIPRPDPDQPR